MTMGAQPMPSLASTTERGAQAAPGVGASLEVQPAGGVVPGSARDMVPLDADPTPGRGRASFGEGGSPPHRPLPPNTPQTEIRNSKFENFADSEITNLGLDLCLNAARRLYFAICLLALLAIVIHASLTAHAVS